MGSETSTVIQNPFDLRFFQHCYYYLGHGLTHGIHSNFYRPCSEDAWGSDHTHYSRNRWRSKMSVGEIKSPGIPFVLDHVFLASLSTGYSGTFGNWSDMWSTCMMRTILDGSHKVHFYPIALLTDLNLFSGLFPSPLCTMAKRNSWAWRMRCQLYCPLTLMLGTLCLWNHAFADGPQK